MAKLAHRSTAVNDLFSLLQQRLELLKSSLNLFSEESGGVAKKLMGKSAILCAK